MSREAGFGGLDLSDFAVAEAGRYQEKEKDLCEESTSCTRFDVMWSALDGPCVPNSRHLGGCTLQNLFFRKLQSVGLSRRSSFSLIGTSVPRKQPCTLITAAPLPSPLVVRFYREGPTLFLRDAPVSGGQHRRRPLLRREP